MGHAAASPPGPQGWPITRRQIPTEICGNSGKSILPVVQGSILSSGKTGVALYDAEPYLDVRRLVVTVSRCKRHALGPFLP
jgi:hypothetical protein